MECALMLMSICIELSCFSLADNASAGDMKLSVGAVQLNVRSTCLNVYFRS